MMLMIRINVRFRVRRKSSSFAFKSMLIFHFRRISLQNPGFLGSLLASRSELRHRPIASGHTSISENSLHNRAHALESKFEVLDLQHLRKATEYNRFSAGGVLRSKSSVASIMLSEDSKWPKRMGLYAGCIYYWNFYQSTYFVRLFLRLPQIFGQRALAFEISVRFHTLSWNTSQFLHPSLRIPQTVDCLSPLMSACFKGDLDAARDLIESRKANLSDRRGSCGCKLWECRSHEGETALFVSSSFTPLAKIIFRQISSVLSVETGSYHRHKGIEITILLMFPSASARKACHVYEFFIP